jgi:hypothetical protein
VSSSLGSPSVERLVKEKGVFPDAQTLLPTDEEGSLALTSRLDAVAK